MSRKMASADAGEPGAPAAASIVQVIILTKALILRKQPHCGVRSFSRTAKCPMNRRRLLLRLSGGAVQSVSFSDFTDLLSGFGFELLRVNGSHHINWHPEIEQIVNI